jgi:hypothetical protein
MNKYQVSVSLNVTQEGLNPPPPWSMRVFVVAPTAEIAAGVVAQNLSTINAWIPNAELVVGVVYPVS